MDVVSKPRATLPVALTSSWQCPGMTLVHMFMKCVSCDNYISPHPVFQIPISSYVYSPCVPSCLLVTTYVPSCLLPHMSPHVYYPYVPSYLLPLCPLMSTTPYMYLPSCLLPSCSHMSTCSTRQVPSYLLTPSTLMSTTPYVSPCHLHYTSGGPQGYLLNSCLPYRAGSLLSCVTWCQCRPWR